MEALRSFLGGAGGAALVAGLFALIQWRLTRKAQIDDKAAEKQEAVETAQDKEIREMRKMMDALITADRTILYDRIKHLAKSYIARGWITVEEYEDLKNMHGVYHNTLSGNGFLDNIMGEIDHLPKHVNQQ